MTQPLLLGVGSNGGGGSTLVRDTFTDVNGTALTGHTMDVGPGWSSTNGTYTIQANAAVQSGTGGWSQVLTDAGTATVTVSANITFPGSTGFTGGLCVRCSALNGTMWACQIDSDGHLYLYEVASGTFTVRASTAYTPTLGSTISLSVQVSGTTVTGTIFGGPSVTYGSANSNQTVTRHGLICFDNGSGYNQQCTWDNFKVTNP